MAANYASKYSALVDERFTEESMTGQAVNADYEWNGVASVLVYDVETVAMNNYSLGGSSRYGSPDELGTGTQTFTVSRDRSFTFTIDRKNYNDQQMVVEAGSALRRQLDEVAIPEWDAYNLAKMIASAGRVDATAITTSNAYEKFMDARAHIRNKKAPSKGLIAFVSTDFYKKIKQDDSFIKASDIAQEMLLTGQVGKVDNIPLVEVPSDYLNGAEFIITHPLATTSVKKIEDYKIHDNPPGVNGWLVEGRLNYDAFVRKNKKDAIAVQVKSVTTKSAAGTVSGKTVLSVENINEEVLIAAGLEKRYVTGATLTALAVGAAATSSTEYEGQFTPTANHVKAQVVFTTASGAKVVIAGTVADITAMA